MAERTFQEDAYALPEPMGESTVRTHRMWLLMAGVVFVMVLGYLGFVAFQSASAYYLTVGELTAKGADAYDKNLRVNGTLVPSSFERDSSGTLIHFSLTDGDETISAVHDGVVPDLFFNEHSEILLEGTYGPEGLFDAEAIIVKCPSKYQALEESV